jgi:hypothetical protein
MATAAAPRIGPADHDGQPLASLVLPNFDATPADLWIDVEEDESGETP